MRTTKLLLLVLLLPAVCFAKSPKLEKETLSVEFMGVDYSFVDVVGAEESKEEFSRAFVGINTLFHTEPRKYVENMKRLHFTTEQKDYYVDVQAVNNDYAIERVALFDDNPITLNRRDISIEELIGLYPTGSGYKVLFIAKELNKASKRGVYIAVLYDGESKRIISSKEVSGLAKGIGLRNYWAYSVYLSILYNGSATKF
ncbi:MAG: hypothetical protein SNG35_07330 [Rikenellaceae bacterium]